MPLAGHDEEISGHKVTEQISTPMPLAGHDNLVRLIPMCP